jgi:hypothetical protein
MSLAYSEREIISSREAEDASWHHGKSQDSILDTASIHRSPCIAKVPGPTATRSGRAGCVVFDLTLTARRGEPAVEPPLERQRRGVAES